MAIPCPQCGHQLWLRGRGLLGHAARCPECSHKFLLEERAEPLRADDSLSGCETIAPGQLAEPFELHEPYLEEFGRYQLLQELGRGAMGTVYLARDVQLGRQVALKIPAFPDDEDSDVLERFYREARSAATLRHSNICPVFDVGDVEGEHYLTMAYIEGRPLSSYVNPQSPLPERQVVGIVRKLASALEHAHSQGIVHRDLKPSNIMVDRWNDPIVMDFGLAMQIEMDTDGSTQTGLILGTPAYMPPEQVRAEWSKIGPCSDIYSLGIVMYELLTGDIPFDGPVDIVMAQVLTHAPPKPSGFIPDLDPRLEAICLKMISKEIDDRYASMEEVDAALADYLRSPKQRARQPRPGGLASIAPTSSDTNETTSSARETSNQGYGTVADKVGDTEPQLHEQPFWRMWRARDVAAFVVAIGLTAATVAYFLFGSDETPTPKPQLKGAVTSLQNGTKKDVTTVRLPADRVTDVPPEGDGPPPPTVPVIAPEPPSTVASAPVQPQIISKATQTLRGHSGTVSSVAFNSDGNRIVSGSDDYTLKVWNTATGQQMLWLKGHTRSVTSVAFSPDGRRIVSGDWNKSLKVWDARSGRESVTLEGHDGWVTSVAFSPDGKWIVSGSSDETLKVWDWDALRNQELLTIKGQSNSVNSVAFSPDGRRIVSGSGGNTNYGELRVWDAASGQQLLKLTGHSMRVTCVAFSSDGLRIVSGDGSRRRSGVVKVWDAETGQETLTFEGHNGAVSSVKFSPDRRWIASGGGDRDKPGELKVWDAQTGRETLLLKGHIGPVTSVAFSPDGRRIVSGSADKTVKVWDISKSLPADAGQ
ncbi:MAG: protein kinase [Planctomycetaceae bacterium]|nr:protein kinase [Planctomycetaceae bacterium]MBT6485926.1 protein kinase [Planctomycetaceae bacterium]